jgi:hypothetical protein
MDLHITLLVMSSLRFADSAVGPCCSLVKYSDGRDKETGQGNLQRQIMTKFWTPPVSLSLTHTHTRTHSHARTRARAHTHTHTHTQTHDHLPSNKTYNHLSAVFIGCTVCFNAERLSISTHHMEFECLLVQTVIFLSCTVLT